MDDIIDYDFSEKFSKKLKIMNGFISYIGDKNYHIIWILVGSSVENDRVNNCHEFPPIIDKIYRNPKDYIIDYDDKSQLFQYVIRIDPYYKNQPPTYPNIEEYSKLINEDWIIKSNQECNRHICITHLDNYIYKAETIMMIHSVNMFRNIYNKGILLGLMSFNGSSILPFETDKYTWIAPNNCMANVDTPFYFPPIRYTSNNDLQWEQLSLSDITNDNLIQYSEIQKTSLLAYSKWKYIELELVSNFEILKMIRINDTMRWLDISPQYYKSFNHLKSAIVHLLWRLEGNELLNHIKKIIKDWKNNRDYEYLEMYLLHRIDIIRKTFINLVNTNNSLSTLNNNTNSQNMHELIEFKNYICSVI